MTSHLSEYQYVILLQYIHLHCKCDVITI